MSVATRRHAASPEVEPAATKETSTRSPVVKPDFTLGTLRKAIPAHCFERSLLRSSLHLLRDVVVCSVLFYASSWIPAAPVAWRYVLWPLYWFFQGAFATGIWVVAHECGHQAFSPYEGVNDAVGLIFHSLLLVPYYSWKHSHRRHHQNTGHTHRDEVFVPAIEPKGTEAHWFLRTPIYRLGHYVFMSTLGWPLYLAFNVSGRPYDRWANHFDPFSPIFTKKERVEVFISDVALGVVLSGLILLGKAFGFAWLLKTYIIPYLIVNHWLVMITYLQHTHPNLPHFSEGEWDWLRGAMSTVDRSYGFLDPIFHHIADTHVAHHLFSQMPHYHAQEATAAIRKVLGPYYQRDDRNVFRAFWEDFNKVLFVTPDDVNEGVYWYGGSSSSGSGSSK